MKHSFHALAFGFFSFILVHSSFAQLRTSEIEVENGHDGRVEIGTESGTVKLKVTDDTPAFIGRGRAATFQLRSTAYGESAIGTGFLEHDAYGDFLLGTTDSNEPLYNGFTRIFAGGIEWLTITGDGKVGVGTSGPSEKLDVAGKVRSNGAEVNGLLEVSGDVRLGGKMFFGGSDNSSYIQHFDGHVGANGTATFNISVKPNDFVNIKVSVGGRAAWHEGGAETNIYGYMYPGNHLYRHHFYAHYPVSIDYAWVNNSTLQIKIINGTGDGTLMYVGAVTVSMHRYGG